MLADSALDRIIKTLVNDVTDPFVKLLFSVATAVFIWGVIQFLANVEDAEQKEAGKRHMIWSIVGMTIMLGVYGIINLIMSIYD